MLRVTADTNILVSAVVFPRGKPYDLLRMALEGAISLTVSQHILGEMTGVLAPQILRHSRGNRGSDTDRS